MSSAHTQRISVIVPVYNAERTIEECIGSLLGLHFPKEELELIFVDNGSTDGTAKILQRYSGTLTILTENKRGAAAARNRGLLSATGEIVAFTDADCLVDKEWLQNLVMPLKDDSIGIVGGKILSKIEGNEIEEFGEKIHDHDRAINEYRPPYVISMNWASRLHVLKKVGLFDVDFIRGQDVDLSWRISQAGYRLVYQPDAVIYHRNEQTLSGLFNEGYVHGFHSVKLLKKHRAFLNQYGYRRFKLKRVTEFFHNLRSFSQKKQNKERFDSAFNLGKRIGKLSGSVRFLYFDF